MAVEAFPKARVANRNPLSLALSDLQKLSYTAFSETMGHEYLRHPPLTSGSSPR